jgi:hypothetical protein
METCVLCECELLVLLVARVFFLGANGVFIIFSSRWLLAILFFGGLSEKIKNIL